MFFSGASEVCSAWGGDPLRHCCCPHDPRITPVPLACLIAVTLALLAHAWLTSVSPCAFVACVFWASWAPSLAGWEPAREEREQQRAGGRDRGEVVVVVVVLASLGGRARSSLSSVPAVPGALTQHVLNTRRRWSLHRVSTPRYNHEKSGHAGRDIGRVAS